MSFSLLDSSLFEASRFAAKAPLNELLGKDGSFVYPLNVQKEEEMLDELERMGKVLSSIIRSPHLDNKDVEVIIRQEQSGSLGPDNIHESILDTSLWKKKRSSFSPEYVHATSIEDNLDTYENRLVIDLCRKLYAESKALSLLSSPFDTSVKKEYEGSSLSYGSYGLFSLLRHEKKNKNSRGLPSIRGSALYHERSQEIERFFFRICSSSFYRELENTTFKGPLIATNVFVHDKLYREAYLFYLRNYQEEDKEENISRCFQEYAIRRFFSFIKNNHHDGVTLVRKNGVLSFKTFSYDDGLFSLSFNPSDDGFFLKVSLLSDSSTSFTHHIIIEDEPDEASDKNAIYFTLSPLANDSLKVIHFSPFLKMEETFENLYFSWLFVIKAEKLDSCPLCGHDRLAYEGGIYICEQCQSEMKEFMDKTERSVWFRRIGG